MTPNQTCFEIYGWELGGDDHPTLDDPLWRRWRRIRCHGGWGVAADAWDGSQKKTERWAICVELLKITQKYLNFLKGFDLGLSPKRRWSLEKGNTSDFPWFPVDGAQAVVVGGECLSVCCREDASQHDSYCWSLKIHWFHITLPFFLHFISFWFQLKMSLTWADRLLRSFSSSSPYDKRVKTQLVADVPGMPRHIGYGTSRWLSWKTATDMRSEVKEISEKTSGLSLHSLKRGNLPVLPCKTRVFWLSGSRWSVWCPMTTMWSTKLVRWKPGWVRWMQPPQKRW